MKTPLLERHGQVVLLALVLAMALSLRLFGQDWDQGTYQHPDERFIAMVSANRISMPSIGDIGQLFDPANSPINPRRDDENGNPLSFAYGTLPLYVQGVVSAGLNVVSDRDWGSYQELYVVGRTLTALLDTVTVALVFLLGRRLFSPAAGFVAALLYTFSVLAIQLAHFFAVDTWLTLFVTATIYLTIRFMDSPTLWRALAVGAAVGLAFSTKASVPALLVPLLFGFGWVIWTATDRRHALSLAAAGGLLSIAVFTLGEPYALVRSAPFIEDIRIQANIVRGNTDIPFTRQFVGLTPGIYELRNMFGYTMGPAFLLASLAGILFAMRRLVEVRDPRLAVPLLWIVAYIGTTITTEARFLRYSLPLMPVFAMMAGGLLVWLIANHRTRLVGQVATAVTLIVTVVWAAGFLTIYMQEHTRIEASQWIFQNVPPGSVLSAEAWDDPLPVRHRGSPPIHYEIRTLDMYGDQHPEQKVEYLHTELQQLDYLVLSSNRLVDSVDNLPWRYAVQNEFYRRLDAGQLGFQLVHEGHVKPGLFGLSINSQNADESFTVYDHPQVRIYQRVEDLTAEEFRERFLWAINQPWEPARYPSSTWLQLDRPVDTIPLSGGGDWNGPAQGNGIVATLSWLAAIEVIGLSVLPLAARAFRRSPVAAALSSRLLGTVLIGWIIWFGASLDFWPATTWTVLAMTGAVAAACWLPSLVRSGGARLPGWRPYLTGLGVFVAGFSVFLLFRAIYPDFWQTYYGGEKPFELAYLRAVTASAEFPPYDPWFADGFINYYYYGWHLAASVIKLSGVGVTAGFQLAIATVGALLIAQCLALASLLSRSRRVLTIAGGLLVFLVVVAGNLDGLRQVIDFGGAVTSLFDFWASTRVIDYTINEFPWFSMIWADLHPHVMNLPHYVLLLSLLAVVMTDARRRDGIPWLLAGVITIVLGTVGVTNSWDAPLAIGLTLGAFLYVAALRGGWHWVSSIGTGFIIVATSFLAFAPFYSRFYSVVEGVGVTGESSPVGQFLLHWGVFLLALIGALAVTTLRRKAWTFGLNNALTVSAVVLATGGLTAILFSLRGDMPGAGQYLAGLLLAAFIAGLGAMSRIDRRVLALVLLLAGAAGVLAVLRPPAAIASAVVIAAIVHGLLNWRHPRRFIPWALIAAGSVTVASVEILYVADDLRNSPWERMNTVFKFYMQAWILIAAGTAILLARSLAFPGGSDRIRGTASVVGIGTLAAALLAGSIYPVLGTPARLDLTMPGSPTRPTLDGYAWMSGSWIHNGTGEVLSFDGDLAAIDWLNDNVSGTPVILEASIGPYRGNGSRISSATGLPTVLGWDRHQRQQRHEPGISQRMNDVRSIYNQEDPAIKLEMLRRYNVRYVIVGDVERLWNTPDEPEVYASQEGLDAFDALVGNGLTRVFETGTTIVYEVEDFPSLHDRTGHE